MSTRIITTVLILCSVFLPSCTSVWDDNEAFDNTTYKIGFLGAGTILVSDTVFGVHFATNDSAFLGIIDSTSKNFLNEIITPIVTTINGSKISFDFQGDVPQQLLVTSRHLEGTFTYVVDDFTNSVWLKAQGPAGAGSILQLVRL